MEGDKMTHQSSNSELDSLLFYYVHDVTTLDGDGAKAKAAILAWHQKEVDKIVEAVIGEDAKHPNGKKMVHPDFVCPDCGAWDEGYAENQLRADQRKRYEALKRGGK